jgi:hypothetical protein
VLLDGFNGYLFPVEDTRGQSRFYISLFKDLCKVLYLACTTGGNDWDGYVIPDVVDQFNVKAAIGTYCFLVPKYN